MSILSLLLNLLFFTATPTYVIYPRGVLEYEKLWNSIKRDPSFKRIYLKDYKTLSNQKIMVFGRKTALKVSQNNLVTELFTAYTPTVSKNKIISFEVSPNNWAKIFKLTLKNRKILLFSTNYSYMYIKNTAEILKKEGILFEIKKISDESEALRTLASLQRNKDVKAIFFPMDLKVLTAKVLKTALKLQYSKGTALFARTKHEVLSGAFLTMEPYYTYTLISDFLKGKSPISLPYKIFFNPLAAKKTGINTAPLQKLGAVPLSR